MLEKYRMARRIASMAAIVSALLAGGAAADLLWDGDASRGTGIFKNLGGDGNCGSGSLTPANDPQRGLVWRYHKPAESNRCENHGIRVNGEAFVFKNGETYYLGWWSKLTSGANNNANFQWKSFGDGHQQNFPVVLKMIGGKMHLMQRQPSGQPNRETFLWIREVQPNTWNHFALALKLSNELRGGYIEFWFNGVKQTLTTGGTRFACRLFDSGNHNCPKWGVYGGRGTTMTNFVDGLKVGTAIEDVLDGGGPGPGPGPGPSVEVTPDASRVTASSDDGNGPGNTVDNSLGSRWSAQGDGQWIQYDLGTARTLTHVAIAAYKGDGRRNHFDLQVSSDEMTWRNVLTGAATGGTGTGEQTFDFEDVSARFLRYVGHQATLNTGATSPWNSVTEISIFALP